MSAGSSAGDLARRLAADIERVAEAVLTDCRRCGSELRGHADDGALWAIETRGAKRGLALNTATGDGGDALSFVADTKCGGNLSAACAWARAWFGESGSSAGPPRPAPSRPPPATGPAAADEQEQLRRRRALFRYLSAERGIAGTPAEAYLADRGLSGGLAPLTGGLRYSSECYYSPEYPALPALVAPVMEPSSRRFLAAHCTYLAHRPNGVWGKINKRPARKCWGRFAGGVIPLLRGASGKRLRDAPDGEGCLIAEGLENALSAAFLRPELRCFAAVAAGNLAAIMLPPQIAAVALACDRDGENDGVRLAYDRAVTRWLEEGRGVELLRPPGGHEDFNAWLQASLREAA